MCNSEENEFCAVEIQIEDFELQNKYRGRYLIQVWTKAGTMVFQRILQYPIRRWNLNGNYLIFVQNEKEPTDYKEYQQIFVIRLSCNNDVVCKQAAIISQNQMYFYAPLASRAEDEEEYNLDVFLGFTEQEKSKEDVDHDEEKPGFLLVATSTHLKYVEVPEVAFKIITGGQIGEDEIYELTQAEVVTFQRDVRILAITEIEGGQPCLITERTSGHLVFLALSVKEDVLQLNERNDKGVDCQEHGSYDPIVKIISTIFQCDEYNDFRQCGLALHLSGNLDFLWNFRVVDQFRTTNPLLIAGIVEDIYADFDFVYYKLI